MCSGSWGHARKYVGAGRGGGMDQAWMVSYLASNMNQDVTIIEARWKLHLRPKGLASSQVNDDDLPPLPANKTAVEVLADFMKYLFECAKTFIKDTHSPELWASVENNIDFVLTHPNGWEGAQQAQIRRAAVRAGFISDSPKGQSRLQLLTEGEASLHFCIANGLTSDPVAVSPRVS